MDDFSPEEMREFNENLNSMNASLGALNSGLQNLSNTLNQTAQTNKQSAEENEKSSEKTSKAETKKTESFNKASDQIETTADKMAGALRIATGAVVSFSGALVSGVDGFDKYTRAVSGFGDSAKRTGDALGGFGKVIGNAVNIITEFAVVTMKQADAQNQFAKEMNRMGAIVDTTTQGLADQARAAGASAGDLQELTVIITQSSQALASFGAGTSEGTAKMLEVFRLSDDQEREMRRYGLTLREAQEQQAYYIELQRTSGINMQAREMTEQDVRIKSLQYAKTLTTLSELTGIQAGQLKEEQAAVQADLRNKIRNIRDQNDIERLKKQLDGNITAEKRASIEAEIKAREQEVQVRLDAGNQFAGLLGKDMAAKVMNVIGTGAFDENTKELANLGLNAAELKERFAGLTAGSDEYKQAVAETTGELVGGVRRNVDRFGKSMELAANAGEIGAAVGINDRTTDTARLFASQDEATNRVLKSFDKVSEATQEGVDTQKDLAAELQVFETNVRTAADEFLNSINPFTGGLGLGTLALGGFTIALGTATMALYGMAGSGAGSGMLDMFTGGRGGGGKRARGLGAAKNFLTKGVSRFAAPLAAGMSIYSGVSEASDGREQADAQLNEVLLAEDSSKAEIQRAKEQHEIDTKQANRKGAGTAIGGAGGALAGAAAGAAIGSFIPIIGTAIGGIIGGALGAWGGSSAGSAIAENYLSPEDLKMYEASDAEVALMSPEEREKYDEIRDAIKEQTRLQEEEATRLEKAYNDNYEEIQKIGLYDKDLVGNSEVNFEMLAQMRDDGTLSAEMLETMLYDNDLSEKDAELVQQQLDLMKANAEKDEVKEKDVAEVKEEEVDGRTLDMSPENLAKIFEADIKAEEKRNAEKQAEQLALAQAKEETVTEQITPEVVANALKETGSGAPTSEVIDTEQLLATTQVVENMIADAGQFTGAPALEEITTTAESIPIDSILEEVKVSSSKVATLIESPAIKKAITTEPMNEATKEFIAWADSDEGKAEIAQNEAERAEKMAEMKTSAEDQMLSKEDAYREVLASGEYKGEAASESIMGQAEKYLATIDETKKSRMAMDSPLNTPLVDISPEPTEEDSVAGGKTADQLAQNATDIKEMTEYEKQSLALQEQQIMRLARIENSTLETADGTQKIAINSSV
jgi:hypothetical protein